MQRSFFVYGTLKPGGSNYTSYLAERTSTEQSAWVTDAALYTPGMYPFLVRDSGLVQPGDQVSGTVITIQSGLYHQIVNLLDELEDYRPGQYDNLYERVILTAQSASGPIDAWTYIAGAQALASIRSGKMRKVDGGVWDNMLER